LGGGEQEPATDQLIADQGDPALPTLGLDFRVTATSADILVEVDLEFALYVEEYAELAEQRLHVHPEADGEPLHTSSESTGTSASEGADTAAASSPNDDIDSGNANQGKAEVDASGSDRQPRRRRSPNVVGAWRRLDVQIRGVQLVVYIEGVPTVIPDPTSDLGNDPISTRIRELVDAHFARVEAARPFRTRTRTISEAELVDETTYRKALHDREDPSFTPQYPKLRLTGFAQALGDDTYLMSVALTNATIVPQRPFQDLAVYDCRLRVRTISGATIQPQFFELAPRDYRYQRENQVWGHGNGCVAEWVDDAIVSSTLPRFYQKASESRSDHVPALRWNELAANPRPILDSVESAMGSYLDDWDAFLQHADEAVRSVSQRERDAFEDEIRRFRLGRRVMRNDHKLAKAFTLANAAFAEVNASKSYDAWRLFQLIYIASHLPALAAREHRDDNELLAELEHADVLWVPTGGGKTEAYLGLIVVALFYDRLRGKQRGVTAWLKFPLRMLSIQQLARVLRVLVVAERLRLERLGGAGEPFELGYLVGSANTPNELRWPQGDWWPGFEDAVNLEAGVLDSRRLVAQCPYCAAKSVGLNVDEVSVRLQHVCRSCEAVLPIHMSDEEVYRYMPAVVVGTVDKLTGFSFFGEFTQFAHGPRWRCPTHGGFSFRIGGKCLAGQQCHHPAQDYELEPSWHDPVPALIIQDEMHLLREELGAFDAHYEGLLVELQRDGPSRLPSKILAASATIEQYEDQLRQIYGRRPRSFPTPGYERAQSFYMQEHPDVRRLYLGVLPHYRRKADVAAIVQAELLEAIAKLQVDPDRAAALGLTGTSGNQLNRLLFDYEVSLGYVNSKPHGDQIAEELGRLSDLLEDRGGDRIDLRVLTGQVKIADLAEPIGRIEEEDLAVPRARRLRALVGTSVVSHGVDLERLNVLVMAGLPTTVADYIQATSRSGRTHVGLVVTVFDAYSRRERSTFVNFVSSHRFLERMVEPVPVNKYAYFGADRTLPGIAMALLWDLARRPSLNGPEQGIKRTRNLQPWWNAQAPRLKPLLDTRLERSYRSFVGGVNERILEDELATRVLRRWQDQELFNMQRFDHDNSTQLFREKVLSSFRDVDDPVDFEARPWSASAFEALIGIPERYRSSADGSGSTGVRSDAP
jgi:hypothetical protein